MAILQGRTLFFITSPRSPMKMQPEIELLSSLFSNKCWNTATQKEFMQELAKLQYFEGKGSTSDMAFSARDRINRGPKALGFVDLKPVIKITEAGKTFIEKCTAEESLLRQMLKFQLPSPFHKESSGLKNIFFVKPFLEIFRLIYTLEKITFDELMIFGLQLTKYTRFDEIIEKIAKFRKEKKKNDKNYKKFIREWQGKEIREIYKTEIQQGKIKTRESLKTSLDKFIKTKAGNMRDYADACVRYLRATGLVHISQKGKSLSILPGKQNEVRFFLENIDRKPCFINNESDYKKYMFNSSLPVLYTDNRKNLEYEADKLGVSDIKEKSILELKQIIKAHVEQQKNSIISKQTQDLKAFKSYGDIIKTFADIKENNYYDVPLMLEWNTWRAMTMLDGGDIKPNLKFDDSGQPMSVASGNMPDILCDYGDFYLTVEVTMQSGQRQYEMEGEPVSRHLAKIKKEFGKDAYCFFIAPKINDSCIAYFYTLHLTNISYYGGKSVIIPIELDVFEKMLEQSYTSGYMPNPSQVRKLCDFSLNTAINSNNEIEWYNAIKAKASVWLTI